MILYAALGGSVQAATCSHRLLVSGFFSTVHVYDACSGAYIKDLDSGSRLAGAQAIRVGSDGNLYVPGFGSHNMVRYDPRTGLTSPVCRFYGSQAPGPNSHFYTIDAGECQALKNLQVSTPATQKRWNFENNDFLSTPATSGSCPAGTIAIWRAYNNGFAQGIDSNHRITSDHAGILQTIASGWKDEGVVMCAPQ